MDAVTRDIEQAVGSRMGGFGVAGAVVVLPASIELRGPGRPAAIETPDLLATWVTMPPEERMIYANDLARRLAEATRAVRAGQRGKGAAMPWVFITIGGVVLLAALGVFVSILRSQSDAPPPNAAENKQAAEVAADARDRAARTTRNCEASRKKAYAGAQLQPRDAEGWEVELWLAKSADGKLADAPALRGLVSGGRLLATADADLARVEDGKVFIEDATADTIPETMGTPPPNFVSVPVGPGWTAARVRFTGGYVDRYFDASGRARFLGLADRVAHASGAGMGALYGRCANLETHELGSWFYGADPRAASAALLYAMGLHAEMSAIPRSIAQSSKGTLTELADAGDDLDVAKLANLVGGAGGTVASAGGTTVAFALSGPVRATSASRDVAKALKLDAYSPAP